MELSLLKSHFIWKLKGRFDARILSRVVAFDLDIDAPFKVTDAALDALKERVVDALQAEHIQATNFEVQVHASQFQLQCEVPRDQFRLLYALLANANELAGQPVVHLPRVLRWKVELKAINATLKEANKTLWMIRQRDGLRNDPSNPLLRRSIYADSGNISTKQLRLDLPYNKGVLYFLLRQALSPSPLRVTHIA